MSKKRAIRVQANQIHTKQGADSVNNDSSLDVSERASCIRGCLLVGAMGDALGEPVEFWSYDKIKDHCGAYTCAKFVSVF